MPSGHTHETINTVLSFPLTAGAIYLGIPPFQAGAFFVGYSFATYFMNPDLDLHSEGYTSWGTFRFFWWPYQRIMAHRSIFSHGPVIGTIFRLIYLLWIPFFAFILLAPYIQINPRETLLEAWPSYGPYLIAAVVGMALSDAIHGLLDNTTTPIKRFINSRSRKSSRAVRRRR